MRASGSSSWWLGGPGVRTQWVAPRPHLRMGPRVVVGAPEVVAAWGPDVDTADGSSVRARMHRGGQRLGLIVAHCPPGRAAGASGAGAAVVTLSTSAVPAAPLPLAG